MVNAPFVVPFSYQVALLDYGQVKQLPNDLRLGYANLILAVADNDSSRVAQSYKYSYPSTFFLSMTISFYCLSYKIYGNSLIIRWPLIYISIAFIILL